MSNLDKLSIPERNKVKFILSKPEWNADDIRHLRARYDYLTDEQKDKLNGVLGSVTAAPADIPEDLGSKKVKELRQIAKEKGVNLKGVSKKADIIKKLK